MWVSDFKFDESACLAQILHAKFERQIYGEQAKIWSLRAKFAKPRRRLIFFIKHVKADSAEQDYQAGYPNKRRKPKILRPSIEQNKPRAKADRDIDVKPKHPLKKALRFFRRQIFAAISYLYDPEIFVFYARFVAVF